MPPVRLCYVMFALNLLYLTVFFFACTLAAARVTRQRERTETRR